MTDSELFDEGVKMWGLGERVDTSQFEPPVAELFAYRAAHARLSIQNHSAHLKKPTPIYFDFLDGFQFGATAFAHIHNQQLRHFIGYNFLHFPRTYRQ